MGYSNYRKLKQVADRLNVRITSQGLFSGTTVAIQPSDWLLKSLEMAQISPLSNEKAKSERIISPVLTEIQFLHRNQVTLFSGEELSVNAEEDLNGACDFFFSANPNLLFLEAPIIALAEAKDEDMEWGLAQCAAQMIAAYRYNHSTKQSTSVIWGCASTGGEWKFLKLENQHIFVDSKSYYLDQIQDILGVFHHILSQI